MSDQDLDFMQFMDDFMDNFDDLNDIAWTEAVHQGVAAFNAAFKRDLDPHKGYAHYIKNVGSK